MTESQIDHEWPGIDDAEMWLSVEELAGELIERASAADSVVERQQVIQDIARAVVRALYGVDGREAAAVRALAAAVACATGGAK